MSHENQYEKSSSQLWFCLNNIVKLGFFNLLLCKNCRAASKSTKNKNQFMPLAVVSSNYDAIRKFGEHYSSTFLVNSNSAHAQR